eukprot:CAMPEP_0198312212 /NCGR_PEP_ID=MMETSP1450-20131203/3665_1 /TAXON_ID=753684 ORGANISM="Madagascaria erythrocladiodes, Strain CCMP3234" /NCGR_SAMPLE_ID=MMETSP1450 /ASSEMBLY_ACC=CAM_ASM_001115 /LENGTH=245 /DNA_ID=CAMNT_0044015147 /DNA_START=100 /DNA_END=834 /DNA_ORIENTATION=-
MAARVAFAERYTFDGDGERDDNNVLGKGGFSVVRRAVRRADNVAVAVKVVSGHAAVQESKAVAREVRALRQAGDHDHIVRLLDVFDDDDGDDDGGGDGTLGAGGLIVMELLEGGELFDEIVARKRFTECDASSVLRQLLSAVAHLHRHGVVHRDIKPENLLLKGGDGGGDASPKLYVKLTDFGMSELVADHPDGLMRMTSGTPAYMAPEQIRCVDDDDALYGCSCDVWSCGVVAYVLLSGSPPFY